MRSWESKGEINSYRIFFQFLLVLCSQYLLSQLNSTVLKLFIPFLWREAVQQVIYMEPFAAFHPFVTLFSSATAL